MELVKNYIIRQLASNQLSQDEAKKLLMELKSKSSKTEDGIAIIGLACRFPGAKNPEEYWHNLAHETNCIIDYPKTRKKDLLATLSNPIFERIMYGNSLDKEDIENDTVAFAKTGYLEDIDKFDAGFFRIPPREAKFIDPLHRLLLETTEEAIEDAGYGGRKIFGTNTGVYIGRDNAAYSNYSMVTENDPMHMTGSYAGILATRISYLYNLTGPGMVIDTACSSGAVAIHQACKALKNNECDYAIAGGVNLFSQPKLKGISNMEMVVSKNSKVRTFDRNANGTVWGEGIGVLLLKSLSKAIADKDNIYAVIKGSAVNNDGASNGITAPNAEAQEEVIVQAWKDANINPESIAYIEAHGTGTVLGDPIEIKGLENAFRRFTDKKQFCGIGSVKPSVGHLVSASGVAGVIKVVLSMKNGMIPASMNFEEPNPYINFCDSPVYVNDKLRSWKKGNTPRRAGMNSFGFSGTNCHIVLEEPPEIPMVEMRIENKPQIMTISAKSEGGLIAYINKYADFLDSNTEYQLQDICYTANTGRNHFEYRVAFLIDGLVDLKKKLALLKESGQPNTIKDLGIFYGYHNLVSNNKKNKNPGDISEEQKSSISRKALTLCEQINGNETKDRQLTEELCKLYASGAEVDWNRIYPQRVYNHLSLPEYPFERVRLWAEPNKMNMEDYSGRKEAPLSSHPLFDDEGLLSIDRYIAKTRFSIDQHWVLREHKIKGYSILPGTTFIEMAKEASKAYFADRRIELRDVVFLTPFVISGEVKEVQTILKNTGDHLEFVVASKMSGAEDTTGLKWTMHAEGNIYAAEDKANKESYNIEALKSALSVSKVQYDVNGKNERGINGPFEFGDRWNNIDTIYIGETEALVFLRLPDKLKQDTQDFYFHPALLDNAVNALSQSVAVGTYLPLSYKSVKASRQIPARFYSYLRYKDKREDNLETIRFDIELLTETGEVFAEIKDYVVKKADNLEQKLKAFGNPKHAYYDIVWVESDMEEQPLQYEDSSILILKDGYGASDTVSQRLTEMGNKVLEVELGGKFDRIDSNRYVINGTEADYRMLLSEIKKNTKITKILHLMSWTPLDNVESINEFETMKTKGLYSLFRLVKALNLEGYTHEISVVLAAAFANKVLEADRQIRPLNAALIGLGRVISQEYPNIKCKGIDIDQETDLNCIIHELFSNESIYGAAYREGKRYEPCFSSIDWSKAGEKEWSLKEDGVYLITGGTGGIGIEIAKHLASMAKVNIALAGRSKMPDVEKWEEILRDAKDKKLCSRISAIKEIQSKGAKVTCLSLDISDEQEVRRMIAALKADFGKVNGIIHGAGVAGGGFIIRKEESAFDQVIGPKINGTWHLHRFTAEEDLDFFVVFSSTATLIPSAGQGDYTAANAYLDSFAAYRNSQGKRTLAINWPAWSETGMAVDHGVIDTVRLFRSISTADALTAFDSLVKSDITRSYVGSLNYEVISALKGELPMKVSRPIQAAVDSYVEKVHSREVSDAGEQSNEKIVIKGIEPDNLDKTEGKVARIWARVFDIQEIDIYENFYDKGGDSILAAQLLKELDKAYPDTIGISDIFTFPSVVELAKLIDERIGESTSCESEAAGMAKDFDSLLESIESGNMSIEDGLSFIKGQRGDVNESS